MRFSQKLLLFTFILLLIMTVGVNAGQLLPPNHKQD